MKLRLTLTLVILGFNIISFAQSNNELLYLNKSWDKLITQNQEKVSADNYYWHAIALKEKAQLQNSISILQEGLKHHPNDSLIRDLLIDLQFSQGAYFKAKTLLQSKSSLDPKSTMQLVKILEFENQNTEAIRILQDALIKDSTVNDYWIHLGNNLFLTGKIKEAIKAYESAMLINPEDQVTANKLAKLYYKDKQVMAAIELCNKVLATDSLNKKFLHTKGLACFIGQKYACAYLSLAKLHALGDTSLNVLKVLAICELRLSLYDDARTHFNQALKQDSMNHELYIYLGKTWLYSQTPDSALFYFETAEKLLQPKPETLEAIYLDKTFIYQSTREYEKVIEYYSKAYEMSKNPEHLFYIASTYESFLDNPEFALKYYELFISVLPEKPATSSSNEENNGSVTISYESVAKASIKRLKGELFMQQPK
jgi:tetratricopeptide (TPR) repeat protein